MKQNIIESNESPQEEEGKDDNEEETQIQQ